MTHRTTERPHGTRAKFVIEHCHCEPCWEANRAYAREQYRKRNDPDWQPAYVDASEARAHLRWLSRIGVGKRAVHERSGVGVTAIENIRTGKRQRARPETIEKILLVFPVDALDHALVPAGPTWKLLEDLIAHGYTRTFIGRELGSKAKTPSLQLRRDFVIASSARKVKALHARLMVRTIAERELMRNRRQKYRPDRSHREQVDELEAVG